jgi:polar amino acid transport system substrate-binding protein
MVDVISVISDKLGYQLELRPLPEKRAEAYLKAAKLNCIPDSRSWTEDPDKYLWTDSVLISRDVIIFRKNEFHNVNSLKEIYKGEVKSIGTILGYNYPTLQPLFSSGKIQREDIISTPSLLKVLQLGRVDAVVTNKFVAEWIINNDITWSLSYDMFRFGPTVAEAEYRYRFIKDDNWLPFISKFNDELAKMKKNGELQNIFDNYLK